MKNKIFFLILLFYGTCFSGDIPFIEEHTHTFRFISKEAKEVSLAGSFNGWGRQPMMRKEEGVFEIEKKLSPGTHYYKFIVDGNWIPDPSCEKKMPDGFGGFNSVLEIEKTTFPPVQGMTEEDTEEGWLVKFTAPFSQGKAFLWEDGNVREETFSEGSFSFLIPSTDAFKSFFLWVETGTRRSEGLRFYRNFSDETSWAERIIYFIMVDRFFNGDPANDKPVVSNGLAEIANYKGGDIRGIIEKVKEGYFSELGVNCLWLSPIMDNAEGAWKDSLPPHRLFTGYHGYWPVSFEKVESRFGNVEDVKELAAVCHEKGIVLMADMVFNHIHKDHPWWNEHPEWFVPLELPDGSKNIRKFDEHPYTTWFDEFLPSFDFEKEAPRRALIENALWWVRNCGFDAFRLDAVKHIPPQFWKELRSSLGKDFFLLGETISSRSEIERFIGEELLNGQFDFPLYWAIRDVFAKGTRDFPDLAAEIKRSLEEYKNPAFISPILGNHDFPRFIAYADGDIIGDEREVGWINPPVVDDEKSYEKLKMVFTFLLTHTGIPLIYYGDEVGLTGAGDPDNRRMMNFSPDKNQKSVFEWVRRLSKLRENSRAFTSGWHRDILVEKDVYVYEKRFFQERFFVFFNKSDEAKIVEIDAGGLKNPVSFTTGKKVPVKKGKIKWKLPPVSSDILMGEI